MTLVCSVAAKQLIFTSIDKGEGETHLDGVISIKKVSDVDNLFQYDFRKGSAISRRIADLDDLEVLGNGNMVRTNFGSPVATDYQTYVIENSMEYELFKDAVAECRMLSEMTLRLGSLTRDIYFAGIYSSHLGETTDLLLCDALQTMSSQQLDPSSFSIFQLYGDQPSRNADEKSDFDAAENVSSSSGNTRQHTLSEINCVFCGVQKTMEISREFAVHPYVPLTFCNKNIYMCVACLHNWKDFREKAILENQLVLKNEVNEELCGICSDTPAELIMCSECPRSFCNVCLIRILTNDEIKDLDSLTDWICMSCKQDITSAPPSLDSRQWCIAKPTINNNRYKYNLFQSKSTSSRLKAFLKNENINNNHSIQKYDKLKNLPLSSKSTPAPPIGKYNPNELRTKNNINSNNDNNRNDNNKNHNNNTRPDNNHSNNNNSIHNDNEKSCEKIIKHNSIVKTPDLHDFVPLDGGLPYLDDFDDSCSTESECNKFAHNIKNEIKNDINYNNNDNDDDCNLIITLPTKNYTNKSNPPLKLHGKSKQVPNKNDKKNKIIGINTNTIQPVYKNNSKNNSKNRKKSNGNKIDIINSSEIYTENVCTNKFKNDLKNKKKKGPKSGTQDSQGSYLPPVNTVVDEVYYFAQYVQYYDGLCESAEKIPKKMFTTDDVCFLCKDGGDLIECDDFKHKNCDKKRRCKKVYHSYCLSYAVEDDDKEWKCPRHFCDSCGGVNLKYICKFCPLSICKSCPQAMAKKYGLSRYKLIKTPKTGEFSDKIHTIVCQNCLDMYKRCIERGEEYCGFSSYTKNVMENSKELLFSNGFNQNDEINENVSEEYKKGNHLEDCSSEKFLMDDDQNEIDNDILQQADFGDDCDDLLFNFTPDSENASHVGSAIMKNQEDAEIIASDIDDKDNNNNDQSNNNDENNNDDENVNTSNAESSNDNNGNQINDNDSSSDYLKNYIDNSSSSSSSSTSSNNLKNKIDNSSSSTRSRNTSNHNSTSGITVQDLARDADQGSRKRRYLNGIRNSSPQRKVKKNVKGTETDLKLEILNIPKSLKRRNDDVGSFKCDVTDSTVIDEIDLHYPITMAGSLVVSISPSNANQNSVFTAIISNDTINDIENRSNMNEILIPKKRGRKPKIKQIVKDVGLEIALDTVISTADGSDVLPVVKNIYNDNKKKMINNVEEIINDYNENDNNYDTNNSSNDNDYSDHVKNNDDKYDRNDYDSNRDDEKHSGVDDNNAIDDNDGNSNNDNINVDNKGIVAYLSMKNNKSDSSESTSVMMTIDSRPLIPTKSSMPTPTKLVMKSNNQENITSEEDFFSEMSPSATSTFALLQSSESIPIPSTSNSIDITFTAPTPFAGSVDILSFPIRTSNSVSSMDIMPPVKPKGRPKKDEVEDKDKYKDKIDVMKIKEIIPGPHTGKRLRHSERLVLSHVNTPTPTPTPVHSPEGSSVLASPFRLASPHASDMVVEVTVIDTLVPDSCADANAFADTQSTDLYPSTPHPLLLSSTIDSQESEVIEVHGSDSFLLQSAGISVDIQCVEDIDFSVPPHLHSFNKKSQNTDES